MNWEIATPKKKKYKLFFWGPEGCFKTRTALRLGNVPENAEPALAVIDTEFGTDHYGGEFRFRRKQTVDPDEVFNLVKDIIKNPNGIRTLLIDSFSIYYQSVVSKYADLFLKREVTSKGNKKEYYVLQPRDYQAINREVYNFIRMLLACDLNVIATCHAKEKWGKDMQIDGSVPDGPKKMSHFFDTVVEIEDAKEGGFKGTVKRKDRTNSLKVLATIPWNTDKVAADFISNAFGHDLSEQSAIGPNQSQNVKGIVDPPSVKIETGSAIDNLPDDQPIPIIPIGSSAITETIETTNPIDQPATSKENLFKKITSLKNELRITDKNEWQKLLIPFDVNSAKEMTQEQLVSFVHSLKSLRPIESQEA